eukprot:3422327-Rhodomonas_salina.1
MALRSHGCVERPWACTRMSCMRTWCIPAHQSPDCAHRAITHTHTHTRLACMVMMSAHTSVAHRGQVLAILPAGVGDKGLIALPCILGHFTQIVRPLLPFALLFSLTLSLHPRSLHTDRIPSPLPPSFLSLVLTVLTHLPRSYAIPRSFLPCSLSFLLTLSPASSGT